MNVAINVVGMIIILLMKINFGYKINRPKDKQDCLFSYILFASFLLLLSNAFSWLLEGSTTSYLHIMHYFAVFINFAVQPILNIAWMFYCLYVLGYRYSFKKDYLYYILIFLPIVITTIICLLSYKYPWFFLIDERGKYFRGTYHHIYVIMCLIYVGYPIIKVIMAYKRHISIEKFSTLLLQPTVPLLAAIIQLKNSDLNLIYISTSIAALIIYFHFQNAMITTDALTGLNNRIKFESYISAKLETLNPNMLVFLIMMDINKFKYINDNFGHLEGDKILKDTGQVILKSIEKNDLACRIGGDEFVVIGTRKNDKDIVKTIEKIRENIANFKLDKPYSISLSIGYSTSCEDYFRRMEDLLSDADKKMYQEKIASRA